MKMTAARSKAKVNQIAGKFLTSIFKVHKRVYHVKKAHWLVNFVQQRFRKHISLKNKYEESFIDKWSIAEIDLRWYSDQLAVTVQDLEAFDRFRKKLAEAFFEAKICDMLRKRYYSNRVQATPKNLEEVERICKVVESRGHHIFVETLRLVRDIRLTTVTPRTPLDSPISPVSPGKPRSQTKLQSPGLKQSSPLSLKKLGQVRRLAKVGVKTEKALKVEEPQGSPIFRKRELRSLKSGIISEISAASLASQTIELGIKVDPGSHKNTDLSRQDMLDILCMAKQVVAKLD